MDHEELRDHIDNKIDHVREDIQELRAELQKYARSHVRLETEQGWIKRGLLGVISALLTAVGFILTRWQDFIR